MTAADAVMLAEVQAAKDADRADLAWRSERMLQWILRVRAHETGVLVGVAERHIVDPTLRKARWQQLYRRSCRLMSAFRELQRRLVEAM